jgi:hypothetical protein
MLITNSTPVESIHAVDSRVLKELYDGTSPSEELRYLDGPTDVELEALERNGTVWFCTPAPDALYVTIFPTEDTRGLAGPRIADVLAAYFAHCDLDGKLEQKLECAAA